MSRSETPTESTRAGRRLVWIGVWTVAALMALAVAWQLFLRPDSSSEPDDTREASMRVTQRTRDSREDSPSSAGASASVLRTEAAGRSTTLPAKTSSTTAAAEEVDRETSTTSARLYLRFRDRESSAPLAKTELRLALRQGKQARRVTLETDDEGLARLPPLRVGEWSARIRHLDYRAEIAAFVVPAEDASAEEPFDIHLTPGARVSGRVVDGEGAPRKAARVVLARRGSDAPERHSTRSDASGHFDVSGLVEGEWHLIASHPAARTTGPVLVHLPTEEPLLVELVDDAPGRLIVVDSGGQPVRGVRVRARCRHDLAAAMAQSSGQSDVTGTVRLDNLPADDTLPVSLEARHESHPTSTRLEQTVGDLIAGRVRWVLPEYRQLRGRVVDGEALPIANVRVRVSAPGGEDADLRTAADGSFHFERLRDGVHTLQASSPTAGVAEPRQIDPAEFGDATLELVLARGDERISGRVLDAAGDAIALLPVSLFGDSGQISAVTDASGRFLFEGLQDGPWSLAAGGSRHVRRQLDGLRGGAELEVKLEAFASIAGRMMVVGPARGHTLRLLPDGASDAATTRQVRFTAQSPTFRIDRVPPGRYRLELSAEGELLDAVDGIELHSGERATSVEIGPARLSRGAR